MDGTLDRDAHAEIERRLLNDRAARRQVALLRSVLAEEQCPPPSAAAAPRYLLCFSQGKLRCLRGPSEPVPPAAPSSPSSAEILFHHRLGAMTVELRVRAAADGVDLVVSSGSARAVLRRGAEEVLPAVDGRFAGLGPARYELRICLGADESPPLVLDIRSA